MSADPIFICASPQPQTVRASASASEPSAESLPLWLRLANIPFSPRLVTSLLQHFHYDPAVLFAAGDQELDQVALFQSRHLSRLRDPVYAATDRQLRWFEKYKVRLILPTDRDYPRLLLTIADPPPYLFVRGSLSEVSPNGVGIVGSRHATPYGRGIAERFGRELASRTLRSSVGAR